MREYLGSNREILDYAIEVFKMHVDSGTDTTFEDCLREAIEIFTNEDFVSIGLKDVNLPRS